MKTVNVIAPAKVNLFLGIGARRDDGYHDVTTVMHALSMHDKLTMTQIGCGEHVMVVEPNDPAQPERQEEVKVEPGSGLSVTVRNLWFGGIEPLDIPSADNLASKAVYAFAQAVGRSEDEAIRIVIEKHIPYQAGLGGGSSDAAAALVGAAELWGIELDDDELKKLGLTDDDVSAIDADTPRDTNAPAPSLSVQQANQATEDTQSVQLRAEMAEAVKQQGEAIEIKARHVNDDVGNIIDEIDSQEKLNAKLYADTPIILPQAAIEAERLDDVHTKILKAELEAEKLQTRAAKLDESVPKPDPKRAAALEDEIDKRTDASKRRKEADLPDDEVVKQATPKPFEITELDAAEAIEPRTAFGKWWQKVRDAVERAKERFDAWLYDFGSSARTLRNAMNVSMVMPGFPYGAEAGGDMPRTEAVKLTDKIAERRKKSRGGQLFTDDEKVLVERWHKSHPERNPESVIAVRMVGKRPVVVDRAGLTHMMEAHHDYLVRVFDLEENIVDGLLELLANGQKVDRQRNYHKKGDSSPRIVYKGVWHGKTITISLNVDDDDRLFGVNDP